MRSTEPQAVPLNGCGTSPTIPGYLPSAVETVERVTQVGKTPLAHWIPFLWADHWHDSAHENTGIQLVCDKLTIMTSSDSNHPTGQDPHHVYEDPAVQQEIRDIAEVPAVEVINTAAVHLMSAAAIKCGLAASENAAELKDLDEARKLITALAGFITAAAPEIGSQHAGPLRDGLRSLQLAFREESSHPDAPGKGPGEKWTGPVN